MEQPVFPSKVVVSFSECPICIFRLSNGSTWIWSFPWSHGGTPIVQWFIMENRKIHLQMDDLGLQICWFLDVYSGKNLLKWMMRTRASPTSVQSVKIIGTSWVSNGLTSLLAVVRLDDLGNPQGKGTKRPF